MPFGIDGYTCKRCQLFTAPNFEKDYVALEICGACSDQILARMSLWTTKKRGPRWQDLQW